MNNRGQVIFYGLMLGLVIIIMALALAGPLKKQLDNIRSESYNDSVYENGTEIPILGLNCSNPLNNNYIKATCVSTDLTLFWFVAGLIFIGGAVVVARIVMS